MHHSRTVILLVIKEFVNSLCGYSYINRVHTIIIAQKYLASKKNYFSNTSTCVVLNNEHNEAAFYNTIPVTFEVFAAILMSIHEDLHLLHTLHGCRLMSPSWHYPVQLLFSCFVDK
jgi:hypothetical protein